MDNTKELEEKAISQTKELADTLNELAKKGYKIGLTFTDKVNQVYLSMEPKNAIFKDYFPKLT